MCGGGRQLGTLTNRLEEEREQGQPLRLPLPCKPRQTWPLPNPIILLACAERSPRQAHPSL